MQHRVFITGAAGYVGAMLCEQFAKREDVELVIGLDREPLPEMLAHEPKLLYIQANTVDLGWEAHVRTHTPDIVVHTAWQIRELYGKQTLEWYWNIDGSNRVFDFAFAEPSVQKLIHFSTVASYGAFADNTVDHFFTEKEPFRKTPYLYAEEKRICEEHLEERYKKVKTLGQAQDKQVFIIRPAAITGPRGRFTRIRFGLQAALSGALRGQKSFLYELVSLWVSWVPVTPTWLRQYVHEDDIANAVALFAFENVAGEYEAFNLAPPGAVVRGADMARVVGKRMLPIYPWMARLAFFWMWHLTRGKIPTSPGSWRGYSYPIAVDGSKISRLYGYTYSRSSLDAFQYTDGRYEACVPSEQRRPSTDSTGSPQADSGQVR